MGKSGQGVARAATVIMLISVLGKLIGFAREQVIASQFGATELTDAFVAAWTVPQMLVGLIAGAIGTAFLPVFMQYLGEHDQKQGLGLLGVTLRLTALLLVIVSGVTFVAAPWVTRLLVPDFDLEQQALTAAMLRIMLPGVLLSGLSTLCIFVLNSFKRFAWSALAPLMMNIGIILATLLLKDRLGIVGLGWATLLGMVLQFCFLFWQVRKTRVSFNVKASLRHPGVKQVLVLALPIMLGTLFGQFHLVVDKGLASGLDAGSIAALNYAAKLAQLPVGIFVTALATAIYPTLAEYAGRGDKAGLATAAGSGVRLLSLVMLPAAVGLIVLRAPVVRLAFERGSFDAGATQMTATALAFYSLGLLGVANIQILCRAFYSLQDSLTPVKVNIGAALVNIALAIVLVKPLGHGGIALANSLAMIGNMLCLVWLLRNKTGQSLGFLVSIAKIAAASGIMGGVVYLLYPKLAGLGQIVSLGLSVGVGVVVYLVLVAALGVEELSQVQGLVKKRLGRGEQALGS